MGQLEGNLHDAMAGADGVDRHADLHAEPGGERQNVGQNARAQGPLAGDGRAGGQAAAAPDRPAGKCERQAETAAHARGKRRDRQVSVAAADRVREGGQLAR